MTTSPSINNSPLGEAEPASIDALFTKEPEELSDTDIDSMVKVLRKQRENWKVAEHNKQTKTKVAVGNIDDLLKDL